MSIFLVKVSFLNCLAEFGISLRGSVPNSIPRQKTYTYLFLISITAVMIYFYSYPLNTENWTQIKEKMIGNVFSRKELADIPSAHAHETNTESTVTQFDSALLRTLFDNGNTTVSIKEKMVHNVTFSRKELKDTPDTHVHETNTDRTVTQFDSGVLRTLFDKSTTTVVQSRQLMVTNMTERLMVTNITSRVISNALQSQTTGVSFNNSLKHIKSNSITELTTESGNSLDQFRKTSEQEDIISEVSVVNSEYPFTQSPKASVFETIQKLNNVTETTSVVDEIRRDSTENDDLETQKLNDIYTDFLNLENSTPTDEKGYVVFSEHCRIPDIDPWDPSILEFIEKSPPLDCSEDYEPLTKTKGNILILDEAATLARTSGEKYTCCYYPVFRILDGKTDDGVAYSECINMSHETIVEDEFIHVKCKFKNETEFYQEFHSFIFDKPKVEERCSNASKSLYNVLIIGVDSVSRLNMHRQLNATANYLLKELDAIEMYGYNKVGDNTFPNLVPLMTGYDERELPDVCWNSEYLPFDNCSLLWKSFAEKGYRTFYAEDSPIISTFNYMKEGFYHQPTDYYFRPFILAYENALGRDKPLNCYQCIGSISETEAVLNWAEQFALHFSNRPYFSFSWINSLTHDFLNMGSAGDHMYERFFRALNEKGALKKTITILISDHGMRWGEIRHTYVGRLEARLPMLFIALPEAFKKEYPSFYKVLRENSHRLITPYDLHATLKHLLDMSNNWVFENTDNVKEDLLHNFTVRGQSLFKPVPKGRSCDDAFIEEHWCTCEKSVNVDAKSGKVKQLAKFLLRRINELLKPVSHKCTLLKLNSILDARLWQPLSEHEGHSVNDDIYTVVIETNPSKAVFEGTIKISKPEKYKILGTISRLNLYGNQSSCVNNAILKKYCYCL